MSGSLRGLASCKGERTGDPYGAVSCAELIELSRRKGKPIPLSAGLRIAKEVLEHLDRLEDACDACAVSPEKILVAPSGDVSIRDVGAGGIAEEATQTLQEGERCGPYSVGAVLYELLTGMRLFGDADLSSLTSSNQADLSAIAQPTARLPLEVRLILASALAREPDERFKGARDFADAIHSFAHHAHVPLGPTELTSWLVTLELWPAHSGMFAKSDLGGYSEAGVQALQESEEPALGDVLRKRMR